MTPDDQFLADIQRKANRLHQASADADRPPANAWSGILASLSNESVEKLEDDMNSLTMPPRAIATPSMPERQQPASRFLSMAASLLLVTALAAASWFAVMQIRDSGSPRPDPRLAAIATPGSSATAGVSAATCDVEPLSVDRVMEIVQNPAYFTANGPTQPRAETPMVGSPSDATLWEVDTSLELRAGTSVPNQQQFDTATSVANEYINCMVYGTQGQVWSFYSPPYLQSSILADFPVYSSQEDVRARVEQRINEPAYTGETTWSHLPFIPDIEVATVNPDRELAILQGSESSYYDQVMMVGVSFKDVDGNQIALTTGTGRDLVPNDPMITGRNDTNLHVVIAKSRVSDTWFIIPWPSDQQIGWPVATP